MLYYDKLEEVIFNIDETFSKEPDKLIIISGYLGPNPVHKLKELKYETLVIGGMYNNGINRNLLYQLEKAESENKNLTVKFSDIEIHSKLYIWLYKNEVLGALIGSANFSSNGLRSSLRESLAHSNRASYPQMINYIKEINNHLIDSPPQLKKEQIVDFNTKTIIDTDELDILYSVEMPLYSVRANKKIIHKKSGLNWGLSDGHVADGDAYIGISRKILEDNQAMFKPYNPDYKNTHNNKSKQSEPIELIWDDGTTMEASLEGTQTLKGSNLQFPKQLTSYSSKTPYLSDGTRISAKSILGRYLRNRIGIKDVNQLITYEDLEAYGRDSIELSFIEDGLYYADFSVK